MELRSFSHAKIINDQKPSSSLRQIKWRSASALEYWYQTRSPFHGTQRYRESKLQGMKNPNKATRRAVFQKAGCTAMHRNGFWGVGLHANNSRWRRRRTTTIDAFGPLLSKRRIIKLIQLTVSRMGDVDAASSSQRWLQFRPRSRRHSVRACVRSPCANVLRRLEGRVQWCRQAYICCQKRRSPCVADKPQLLWVVVHQCN